MCTEPYTLMADKSCALLADGKRCSKRYSSAKSKYIEGDDQCHSNTCLGGYCCSDVAAKNTLCTSCGSTGKCNWCKTGYVVDGDICKAQCPEKTSIFSSQCHTDDDCTCKHDGHKKVKTKTNTGQECFQCQPPICKSLNFHPPALGNHGVNARATS